MRILYCNKYNYPFSGTEVYLFEVMPLMQARGHEVALFSMLDPRGAATAYDRHFVPPIDFKQDCGLWEKSRRAGHAIYSLEARRRIRSMIREFRPDVAHARNIYHHLSPSILWELKTQNVPVVYHVNDFKLLCPSYNLVSEGGPCEACKGGEFWHALQPRCYPGLGARLTLTLEAYVHRWFGTYAKCVDLFLAPSQFVRQKFVEHGWKAAKFEVLPHFQKVAEAPQLSVTADAPVLYFGRLSAEKGVDDLLRAAQQLPMLRFVIAGDGPERENLSYLKSSLNLANVKFLGHVDSTQRDALIIQSRFTVLPSHAYETLGKTILESYAQGRAVIATDMGSRRELVHHGETGLLYRAGDIDQLTPAIQNLASRPEVAQKMGQAGWEFVRERFAPETHYQRLMALYDRIAERKRAHRGILVPTAQEPPWKKRPQRARHTPSDTPVAAVDARRLKIAFVGGRGVISKYSGIEAYYEEVGKRLAGMGHEVTVYCRTYFTPSQCEHNGMRLVRLPTIRSKHLETVIHTALSTAHSITRKYDLVHYHALGPALFSWLPKTWGTKTAVTVQGLDWQRKKWGRLAAAVLRLGEGASVRLPDATMVVSRALQRRYCDIHGLQALYIPNGGVLRERSEPRKIVEWGLEPNKYILFLGRFSPEKGCHLLVEAYEQLEAEVKLVLAGASSYCDEYGRRLRTHASDRIRMLDWVSGETLDELLTNAMIFVLPSDLEGLSLALLDAMGAGLCVLTSDVPENREVVEGAGFMFRRGNSADLADRLRFLIANPAIREAAGKAAKRRIQEQYQWDQIASEIETAYLDILGWKPVEVSQVAPKKASSRVETAEGNSRAQRRVS